MSIAEALVRVRSAEAHHLRLCERFDRGESVAVALRLAHGHLVRVKADLAALEAREGAA